MSRRTSEASKAIAIAWANEKQLVMGGKGTRDWTLDQQRDILTRGKAYDEDGKAFEGHHMQSVEAFPEHQGDADNIQFLSRIEHSKAHDGYKNSTNGYYDPVSGETRNFASDKYEPCKIIELSGSIIAPNDQKTAQDENEDKSNAENSRPDSKREGDTISGSREPLVDVQLGARVGKPLKSNIKEFIGNAARGARRVATYLGMETKEDLARVVVDLSLIALAVAGAFATGMGSRCESSQKTDHFEHSGAATAAKINEPPVTQIATTDHLPRKGHIVGPHGQHYGKGDSRAWRGKAAYSRGKK